MVLISDVSINKYIMETVVTCPKLKIYYKMRIFLVLLILKTFYLFIFENDRLVNKLIKKN